VTLRVVIVDDEQLPRQRVADLVRSHRELDLVAEASDGRSALDAIVEHQPDLVFLDIQMPELDGFQVISALDDEESLPAFVFVTAYDEYAIRAFEVDALDYLLKPLTAERFAAAVARVMARLNRRDDAPRPPLRELASRAAAERGTPTTRFVARRGSKHYFVRVDDIDWIEAEANYVRLVTGDKSHLIRETMKSVEARLDPSAFVRIHRSAIVAVDRIQSIEARDAGEYVITMPGGAQLMSSRSYGDRVRNLLR
jgi:two-component system, LytTR family, response regulator